MVGPNPAVALAVQDSLSHYRSLLMPLLSQPTIVPSFGHVPLPCPHTPLSSPDVGVVSGFCCFVYKRNSWALAPSGHTDAAGESTYFNFQKRDRNGQSKPGLKSAILQMLQVEAFLTAYAAQSFVKLSDVIKDGHTRSKDGGADIENRHRQLLEKLDSQNVYFLHIRNGINSLVKALTNLQWTAEELRTGGKEGKSGEVSSKGGSLIATVNRNMAEILERYPVDLAAMTDEITKSVKSLEGIMKEGLEKKRPAEGPPPVPVEPKRVKFQVQKP